MSTIKAVDKLRGWADVSWEPWAESRERLHKMLDEIEAEVEERYTLLPLDADGMPIRVGDKLTFDMNDPGICTGYDWLKSDGKWMIVVRRDWHNGCVFLAHDKAHHVKPRTLEDMLESFANAAVNGNVFSASDDFVRKCADEIRAMFGEVD